MRRATLHAALTHAVTEAGIPVHPWAAVPIRHDGDEVVVVPERGGSDRPASTMPPGTRDVSSATGTSTAGAEATSTQGTVVVPGTLRARYAVAADGLHSPQRRALGLDVPSPEGARRGLRRH